MCWGGNALTQDSKLTVRPVAADLSSMTFSSCCHNIVRMSQLHNMSQDGGDSGTSGHTRTINLKGGKRDFGEGAVNHLGVWGNNGRLRESSRLLKFEIKKRNSII